MSESLVDGPACPNFQKISSFIIVTARARESSARRWCTTEDATERTTDERVVVDVAGRERTVDSASNEAAVDFLVIYLITF